MKARNEPIILFYFSMLIALCAVSVLPFFAIRANRTETGLDAVLYKVVSPGYVLILSLLCVSALGFVFRRYRVARVSGFGFLALALPAAIALLAYGADAILIYMPPAARVSIGLGFWLFLAAVYGASASFAPVFGQASDRALGFTFVVAVATGILLAASGSLGGLSIMREYANRRSVFLAEAVRHAAYAGGTTLVALAVSVPLGYLAAKSRFWERPIFVLANAAQAVPTLSLLGLLIVPLSILGASVPALGAMGIRGVGWAPASIVLFLYAVLPIAANAHAGFRTIEPSVLFAARGVGMTGIESFLRVELPLALPAIIAGFRTALTQNLGNAVLAGLIGGGGLGSLIFLGLAQAAPDLILLGALPVIAAAFFADRAMAALERVAARKAGLEGKTE